jgi:amino acid transporter
LSWWWGFILAGAANTAIVGSNGVLNRVAEDGVLTDWFRKPHRRFGTTYRLINLIVALQLVTIVLSRGDVYVLGEAYAFGVVWSFAFNAVAVLILRYKRPRCPARLARAAEHHHRTAGAACRVDRSRWFSSPARS